MAKTVVERLQNLKVYKEHNGHSDIPQWAIPELTKFCEEIGFSYHRMKTVSYWIKLGLTDWANRFSQLQQLPFGTQEYQQLYHGKDLGLIKYKSSVAKRTAHFDHSPEKQRERGRKSSLKTKGNSLHSVRSKHHWIAKGYSEEQAVEKVKEIQTTNSIEKYTKKYGIEGERLFLKRQAEWMSRMQDPAIHKSRSLGIARYIERYGEDLGKLKYMDMRKKRNQHSRLGKASNESIKALANIINFLEQLKIEYYVGLPGKREWFIFDDHTQRPYFYDLTIPRYSIIIEYHGEGFHPNPTWDNSKWLSWRAAFNNVVADEQYERDCYKKTLAEGKGWSVYEIYSSDTDQINLIYNKLQDLANSMSSPGT